MLTYQPAPLTVHPNVFLYLSLPERLAFGGFEPARWNGFYKESEMSNESNVMIAWLNSEKKKNQKKNHTDQAWVVLV